MELDELKKNWQVLNERVNTSNDLNHKIVDALLKQKTMTTVDKMKKNNGILFFILIVELMVFIAILIGNPFDFIYKAQYIPFILLLVIISIAAYRLYEFRKVIDHQINGYPVQKAVESMLSYFTINEKSERIFGVICLSIGLLIPWSFLPTKLEKYGTGKALLDIMAMEAITVVIYFLAFKFGAFKNRYQKSMESSLDEWQNLKEIAKMIEE